MRRFLAPFSAALASLVLLVQSAPAQTPEDLVKATFLYRFVSFVTWPQTAFSDAQTPIRLCVIGADGFAETLERVVVGQHADGRAFEVRRVNLAGAASGCHVVYVTGDQTAETLRSLYGRPVLTVTDGSDGRGDVRGMIHFVIIDDRVRFHVDDARAADSGIVMSSRLLALAVSVRRRAGA